MILPLQSPEASLALAGGKGANLSALLRSGFPVPPGFVVSTLAYQAFLNEQQLGGAIEELLEGLEPDDPEPLESASRQIRARFTEGEISAHLAAEILQAYAVLGMGAVAVRSSATAEDLPGFSFAGQQDTFLNVSGGDAVLAAVRDCWSSLWTARAIGYRVRNAIPLKDLRMAVVVQRMAESISSGVLFTGNPLSGLRHEVHIDATFGLGEALVAGKVEPDHYVVDNRTWQVISRKIGSKAYTLHSDGAGGTRSETHDRSAAQALHDEAIIALARMGAGIQERFGYPQDIEWAWTGEHLVILQARPVTTLFPTPENLPANPPHLLVSFAAIQGIMTPLTPAGQSMLKTLFAAGGALFGKRYTEDSQPIQFSAGERLWVDITPVVTSAVGRRILPVILRKIEPTIWQAVAQVWEESSFLPRRGGSWLGAFFAQRRFLVPFARNLIRNLRHPAKRREEIIALSEGKIESAWLRFERVGGSPQDQIVGRIRVVQQVIQDFIGQGFIPLASAVGAGIAAWTRIRALRPKSVGAQEWEELALALSRAVPHNPTTEMDFQLWRTAQRLKVDPVSRRLIEERSPDDLGRLFLQGELPPLLLEQVQRFLQVYGGRGLAEIDFGRQRWAEDPRHIFSVLAGYMANEDPEQAPDLVYTRGSRLAAEAAQRMESLAREGRLGKMKAARMRFLIDRSRHFLGMREYPKFTVVRLLALIRSALRAPARALVGQGILEQAEDIFFLKLNEMPRFARETVLESEVARWKAVINERKQRYQREMNRKQLPRLILSDGRAIYGGLESSEPGSLQGDPVSPGTARGRVRVVLDPRNANVQPGEILVCPGTDPSWTLLFLNAAGLVMETGGMMTHGAVVAREYGIPALVGVDQATTRLPTGTLVELDGSSGSLRILENAPPEGETVSQSESDPIKE